MERKTVESTEKIKDNKIFKKGLTRYNLKNALLRWLIITIFEPYYNFLYLAYKDVTLSEVRN